MLKQSWESLPARFGQPGPRAAPHNSLNGGYVVVTVPMPFQNAMLAAQVACATDGRLAGFHVVMAQPPQPAVATSASTPLPATSTAPAAATSSGH